MSGRVLRFRRRSEESTSRGDGEALALRVFEIPLLERGSQAKDLKLEEPETLLSVFSLLRFSIETDPSLVRDEASFFYEFLKSPIRPIGLFDEREYFLGEVALLAGTACRLLFRREEAKRWFDRSEAEFRNTVNAISDWARVTYQRLALQIEERGFQEVLELLPSLIQTFDKLGMADDALKSKFLEGVAFMNTDRLEEAITVFQEISFEAGRLRNERLAAIACNNLVQLHGMMGNSELALTKAQQTLELFRNLDNRVGIGKLQWGIGILLRTKGQLDGAAEAFCTALETFKQLEMRADMAALELVLADVLLEMGDEASAMRHVMEALPIIRAEGMVPEGLAALSLLQESLRHDKLNAQALRALHGYFAEERR